jgi:hypothetical protein
MTQSKIAIAKRLAELRGDGSDPETLARTLTVMKMHHEIEKILEAQENEPAPEPEAPQAPQPEAEFKPLIQSLFESFFGTDRD